MAQKLVFRPWISEAYAKGQGKYGRLLLLGESHYVNSEDDDEISESELEIGASSDRFTTDIVSEFINGDNNIRFFKNLGKVFNENDPTEVWKNAAFANLIQVPLQGSSAQPTSEDLASVKDAFSLIMEEAKPDKLIVCSQRMWNSWIPEDPSYSKIIATINENERHTNVWEYVINGHRTIAIGINHPSRSFSWSEWKPLVHTFLSGSFG